MKALLKRLFGKKSINPYMTKGEFIVRKANDPYSKHIWNDSYEGAFEAAIILHMFLDEPIAIEQKINNEYHLKKVIG